MRRATIAASLVGLLAAASGASAQEAPGGKPRVVVLAEGSESEPLRAEALAVLGERVARQPSSKLERGWTEVGGQGTPHLEASGRLHREALLSWMRRAARTAGLDAVVVVRRPPRRGPARVVVIVPTRDTPLVDAYVDRNPKLADAELRDWLVDAVEASSAPTIPAPPPAPAGSPDRQVAPLERAGSDPSPDASPVTRPSRETPPWIDAAAGLELGVRDLHYNDRVTTNLRSYTVVGAPLAAAAIDVAPFAGFASDALRGFGLVGSYATSIGLSTGAGSGNLPTTWSRFSAGPRFRLGIGEDPVVSVGGSLTYGGESFSFSRASGPLPTGLPAVDYRDVRPALEARVRLGRISLRAEAGYDHLLSTGDVGARMQGTSAAGVDAGLSASVALGLGFEARLGAEYRRYFYAFHPAPGDTFVAGGAVDQMACLRAGLAWAR